MLKKLLVTIVKTIIVILGIIVLYVNLGFLIPYISVSAKKTSDPALIDMYILTNGDHTDLVVPVKTPEFDWSKEILFENTVSKRTDFNYVGIGWGDKGFYLDTPTWAELKFSTAFKAAFGLSTAAMHCTFYEKMTIGKDCRKISLTNKQYADLVKYIQAKFMRDSNGKVMFINTDAVYGKNDAFYDAKGVYSFMYTCNTWANNGLKAAGQKAAIWTPFDKGIFMHYE